MRWAIFTVTVVLGGSLLVVLLYEDQEETREYARRLLCESKQKAVYSGLSAYHKEHGELPSQLVELVHTGYVRSRDIRCPGTPDDPNNNVYMYFPKNFGDAHAPILSERWANHPLKRSRRKWGKPVRIQTMGDGTVLLQTSELDICYK